MYKRKVKNDKKLEDVNAVILDCEARSKQGLSDREKFETDIEELKIKREKT
jgi:hypothetical protein